MYTLQGFCLPLFITGSVPRFRVPHILDSYITVLMLNVRHFLDSYITVLMFDVAHFLDSYITVLMCDALQIMDALHIMYRLVA
jgi:hypothetical protein